MALERLILLRHGKAEGRAPSGEDFDRALTARGHANARRTGQRLAELGIGIELALVSSAVRAKETWDEAGLAFPNTPVEHRDELYHADPGALAEAAVEAGAASVVLVGHNPGMHALAFGLAQRGSAEPEAERVLREGFPTASAAVFRFADGHAHCERVLTPKDEGE